MTGATIPRRSLPSESTSQIRLSRAEPGEAPDEITYPALFETILRFQNYPGEDSLQEMGGSLKADVMNSVGYWHFPLDVVVVPDSEMLLQISYDGHRFGQNLINEVLRFFSAALVASYIPARKATRVDPVLALREE